MTKVAILIDGGHLRVQARRGGFDYTPDFIEWFAHGYVAEGETLFRTLYYDCAPYVGAARKPVSGEMHRFEGDDGWLRDLASRNLFAVRRGTPKFRGFKPRDIPIADRPLTDDDFMPDFEQKGVDMRIGLDIANFAANRAVEMVILATADTDCIPAMKHARIAGIQIAICEIPGVRLARELLWHSAVRRPVAWPPGPA